MVVFHTFSKGLQLYTFLATLSLNFWSLGCKINFPSKNSFMLLLPALRGTDWNHKFERRGTLSLYKWSNKWPFCSNIWSECVLSIFQLHWKGVPTQCFHKPSIFLGFKHKILKECIKWFSKGTKNTMRKVKLKNHQKYYSGENYTSH